MKPLRASQITISLGALLLFGSPVFAQDDVPPQMECLRYLQVYERSLQVPQGLTTAISLVETGRPLGPNQQLMPWPWTINVNGQGKFFATKDEAVAETRKLVDDGQQSIDIGCMQVNLRYHPTAFRTLDEAFDPAANVAYGTQFLNSLHQAQGSWEKAVERYHSSDDGKRGEYRDKVLALWNGDVRNLVMNAVLAENTNTPYHFAMRDFAAGQYANALAKYQAIVNSDAKDRLGLLGLAMSYEQLGRIKDADEAYARYIAVDPDNEAVLARLIQKAKNSPALEARNRLEALVNEGVNNAELFSVLADIAARGGDNESALKFASRAVEAAPAITIYHLNAGIFADRVKQPMLAVKYYDDFLAMIAQQPVVTDVSIDTVRDRLRFLRGHL